MKQKTTIVLLVIILMALFSSAMAQTVITLGTQVVASGTSGIGPTNYYWEARRIQFVYTATEITTAGGFAGDISALAFDVSQVAGGNLLNYKVKMAHTTAVDASTHNTATLTTVKNAHTFTPGSTGWRTITFDTNFTWDGSSNILVDISWGVNTGYASNGQTWLYNNVSNQMRGVYSSSSSVENTATTTTRAGKPRAQLTITALVGVLNPTGFTATAVSQSQIDLGWTKNANNDNVMVAWNTSNTFGDPREDSSYSVDDELDGGGTVIYNGSGTSYNHTPLSPNTPYYYKAWSVESSKGIAYSTGVTANARTFLAPIATFPWDETFETDSPTRAGWTQIYEAGVADWTYATGSNTSVLTTAHGGTLNARFVGVSGTNSPITKLISPVLDLSAKATYVLSFWYGQPDWAGDQNTTKVYYRTSPAGSWVQIAEYTADASVWTEEPGIVLPNPSATYQIAIEGINNYGYPNVVDDVKVDTAAVDPVFVVSPTLKDFGSQQIGTSSAPQVFTIKNNGGGTLTVYGVAKGGTNATEFDLTDLNDYEPDGIDLDAGESITVSVVFSPDTTGNKEATLTITHDQPSSPTVVDLDGVGADTTIREIPYIQTWDVPELIDGWVIYNVNADGVIWGLTTDGSDISATISYNSSLAMDDWLISPPVVLDGGTTYTVTYDYRCASATYPERMEVAFGNAQNPTAMTEQISDHYNFVNTLYQTGSGTFTPDLDGTYYLGFHGYSAADMYNIYVDDVRILLPNTQVGQVIATGATADVTLPQITVDGQPIAPAVAFAGLSGDPVIQVSASYGVTSDPLTSERLVLSIDGGNLAGVTVTFTHGLGFTPGVLAYQIGEGQPMIITNPGDWNETTAYFTIPGKGVKGPLTLKTIFPKDRDDTLPVELSSFTAVVTSDLFVRIAWTAQSETNHAGYNLFRAEDGILESALQMNPSLISSENGEVIGSQVNYAYMDTEAFSNMIYYYWLESRDLDGTSHFYGPLMVTLGDPTQEPQAPGIPMVTKLMDAFPNPFNPSTTLRYSMKEPGKVSFDIYNLKGQKVRTYNTEHYSPGYYRIVWDGKDNNGQSVSSGIYMYRMNSGSYSSTKKMILAK